MRGNDNYVVASDRVYLKGLAQRFPDSQFISKGVLKMSVTLTDYRSIIRDNASLFHLSKDPSYRKVYLDNIINHSEHLVPWEELSTIEKQLKNSATIIRLIQEYICECSDEHGIFKGPGIIKITLEREAFEQREFIVDLIKTYYS